MKRYLLLSILLFSLVTNTFCQLKTYISVDAGPSWDISPVQDPGTVFSATVIPGETVGITIWQEFLKNLSLGTGAYLHNYSYGINFNDQRPHQASFQASRMLLIPLRLSYRIKFEAFPFGLTPILGYQHGIQISSSDIQSTSSYISTEEGTLIRYNLLKNSFFYTSAALIEAGVNVDYRFKNNWQLSLSLSYLRGLKEMNTSTMTYLDINGISNTASYTYNGTRTQTAIALYAPISNLWENRDLRLHRRIENASSKGSSLKNYHYIYFGGDLAAIWRLFSNTNPAVGPYPMRERGIFRYSNLQTGVYLGYMFNDIIGLDIGGYLQRSTSFFTLMYDHEVNYVNKARAPYFLEFPLMFRYFYKIYRDRLSLTPAIGISLLTHLSTGEYINGTGSFDYGLSREIVNYSATRVNKFGYLLKLGIGLEYKIPVKFGLIATCNLTYSHGLKNVDRLSINTSLSESPENSYISYKGSGILLSIGIKKPILIGKENRKCGAGPI
ncbi:hypothetical protein ACFLRQ_01060 [Bacteroidota bacterium]